MGALPAPLCFGMEKRQPRKSQACMSGRMQTRLQDKELSLSAPPGRNEACLLCSSTQMLESLRTKQCVRWGPGKPPSRSLAIHASRRWLRWGGGGRDCFQKLPTKAGRKPIQFDTDIKFDFCPSSRQWHIYWHLRYLRQVWLQGSLPSILNV